MRVCLVDDNFAPGGQTWRSSVAAKALKAEEKNWLERIRNDRIEIRTGWRVVSAHPECGPGNHGLRIEQSGRGVDIECGALIVATGAREMFVPFPGWTLPGVYGAGGLQAFAKSGLDVAGKRIVVAGTGPLLLAVAAGLHTAGARIVSIVEQVPASKLAVFCIGLARGHINKLIEGAGYVLRTAGTRHWTGAWVTKASGGAHLETVAIQSGTRSIEVEADMLAIGYHLVPNIELAQLLQCRVAGGYVDVDQLQQTSIDRVYCVGEAAGIGGVDKALIEGRIAALSASGQNEQAATLFEARDRHARFARRMAAAFKLRNELRALPNEQTVVCRCEDVRYGAVASCNSWREAKLHTRCGMGPCQGRLCGPATEFMFDWKLPLPRPPLFPVEASTLSGVGSSVDDAFL
jgi:NADPH-dependent 2,4-dienoyl-CoA reductase/sulfur reductase-like enzyme